MLTPRVAQVALTALAVWTPLARAANATFYPKINMTDSSGTLIQAHGGAILQSASPDDNDWYWFGEDKTGLTNSGSFIGVNCYRSSDFVSWERVGHVLSPQAGTNISDTQIVERPKVIYNEKNDEYVMWFHGDSSNYGAAQVGVATSPSISDPYTWRGNFKPFGNDSRDQTVWKDPETNIAYLIYATNNNADFSIASLDSDYYTPNATLHTFEGVYWEAPGVFKIDGTFYLIFSKQDGWTPTDNFYMTATSMAGPWSEATLLAPEGSYAYLTQNAYDIVIQGSEQTTYLYYGDHWSGNFLGSSTYSFHPAVVEEGGKLSLHNTGAWTLDLTTGVWSDLPYVHISAADSTTPKENLVECEDGCEGGSGANMTDSSSFSFTFAGNGGAGSSKVLGVEYVYNGPKNKFLHASVSVNGVEGEGMVLMETSRGTTFAQEAPFPVGELGEGDEVDVRLVDWDGNVVLVEGVRVYEDLR